MPLQMVPTRRLHAVQRVMPVLSRAGFDTARSAPLPSPLPVDVGNPLVVVDTENKASQSGGRLVLAPRTVPTQGDPGLWGAALTRLGGRAVLATVQVPSAPAGTTLHVGWDSNQSGGLADGLAFGTNAISALVGVVTGTFTYGVDYQVAVVQRLAGGTFQLVKGGTQYPNWTLLWVTNVNTSGVIPGLSGKDVAQVDDFRFLDLPYPWSDPYGIATFRLVSPAAGITKYPMTADAVLEFTFAYSSATVGVDFRKVDGSNLWRCIATAGGALNFGEINNGVNTTTRINVAATFTGTNTYRVVIVAVGNVYSIFVNDVLKGTYTDGTNFQTGITQFSVSFAPSNNISEVVAWPRTTTLPPEVG